MQNRGPEYNPIDNLVAQCLQDIPARTTIGDLRTRFQTAYNAILDEEKRVIAERDKQGGRLSLTTDTHGAWSEGWFTETRKIASTGRASYAVVGLVCHPGIGMAAAHMNTIKIEDILRSLVEGSISPSTSPTKQGIKGIVTPMDMATRAAGALNKALEDFSLLTLQDGLPEQGMILATFGMSYLDSSEAHWLTDIIESVIPQLLTDRGAEPVTEVCFVSRLGVRGEVVYGGRRHPTFPQPTMLIDAQSSLLVEPLLSGNTSA